MPQSAILMSCTEANMCLPQVVTYMCDYKERMRAQRGTKLAPALLLLLLLVKKHISGKSDID